MLCWLSLESWTFLIFLFSKLLTSLRRPDDRKRRGHNVIWTLGGNLFVKSGNEAHFFRKHLAIVMIDILESIFTKMKFKLHQRKYLSYWCHCGWCKDHDTFLCFPTHRQSHNYSTLRLEGDATVVFSKQLTISRNKLKTKLIQTWKLWNHYYLIRLSSLFH